MNMLDIHAKKQKQKICKIREKRKLMELAAKALDFLEAARFRDEITAYQSKMEKLKVK